MEVVERGGRQGLPGGVAGREVKDKCESSGKARRGQVQTHTPHSPNPNIPPPHPPTPPQAKAHRLEVHQQRDRATGDVFYILNGSQRFLEG